MADRNAGQNTGANRAETDDYRRPMGASPLEELNKATDRIRRLEVDARADTPKRAISRESREGLPFETALAHLKAGYRVARAGWNGRGQYLELQEPTQFSRMTLPYVFIHTVQGDLVPWLCSQTDLLARDWCLVAEKSVLVYGDGHDTIAAGPRS